MFSASCKPGVYAGIDCGTGGIRMIIFQVEADGSFKRLEGVSVDHKIGKDLNNTGAISPETITHLSETTKQFIQTAEDFGTTRIRAVATESIRSARNGPEVLAKLAGHGIPFELLTGIQELELSLLGARSFLKPLQEEYYFADSGGDSTEIALVDGTAGAIMAGKSLRVGVSSMAKQLMELPDKPNKQEIEAFTDKLSKMFSRKIADWDKPRTKADKFVIAGSPLYLKRFQLRHETKQRDSYLGALLTLEDLIKIATELAELGHEGRKQSPYLDSAGVYFMLPAAIKALALLKATGTNKVMIAPSGICAGLALQQAAEKGAA